MNIEREKEMKWFLVAAFLFLKILMKCFLKIFFHYFIMKASYSVYKPIC